MHTERYEAKYIGQINIPDGIVDITDPCYDKDVWCRKNGVKVKKGIYNCYSIYDKKVTERRVSRCRIVADDIDESVKKKT